LIRLIGMVFSNGAVLSVSDKCFSKRTHPRDQQINEITYSRGVAKFP